MTCPVKVRGQLYPSITAAAAAHGVTTRTCQRHLRAFGHLDNLNRVTRDRPDRRRAIVLFGHRFASVSEAARTLGLDRKTIRNMKHREAARMTVLRALMTYATRQEAA